MSTPSPHWRLHAWGIARLESADKRSAIELARKDAALLVYVASERGVATAQAADMLWPGGGPKSALNNCRQRLHRLRKATGARLLDMASTISLANDLVVEPDDTIERLCEDPSAGIDPLLASHAYDDEPEFAAWLAAQRQARKDAVADALADIAARHEREGRLALALRYAQRLAAYVPLSEHAHRRLMRVHYLRGDNAAAIAVFEACERTLKNELSARPGAETLALLQTIEQAARPQREAPREPVPVALLRPPRTVGRDDIARQLAQAHAEGALPVLIGEAGIGKTRLLQDFIATRPNALYVQARPSDASVPYGTLARVVRALAPATTTTLVPGGEAVDNNAPAVGPAPLATWQAPATPAQTVDEIAALAARGAASGIETLVVDDLHFADRASVEVLRSVLDDPRAGALRWICAHRPQSAVRDDAGLLDTLAEVPQVRWLMVGPLTEGDAVELLASLALHDPERIAPLASALLRHAGGNPLYLIETLRAMTASGLEDMGSMPRAASIEHLLDRRLRQLSAPALMLARVAAIAGTDFSIALAEHALSTSALALADPWAELESADLLRGEAFAHDLIRDAVLRATPHAVARRAHEQIAGFCARLGAEPARVAAHWHAASNGAEAAAAFRHAAERALASGRTREHCELLEAAAQSHEMAGDADAALQARLAISDQLVHVKGPAAVLEHLERLLERAQTPDHRASALYAHAQALLWAGRWTDAESSARSALALTGRIEATQQVRAASMLAQSLSFQGRDDEALSVMQCAQVTADGLTSLGDQADFYNELTVLLIAIEKPMLAWPCALRHLDIVRREGSATRLVFCLLSLFALTLRRGELVSALSWAEEAHALIGAGQQQATALAAHTGTNVGIALCAQVRYREGLAALRAAAEMMTSGANPMVAALNADRQVEWLLVLGQTARAQSLLADGDDALPANMKGGRCVARALLARALGAAEQPWWEQALTLLDERRDGHQRIRAAAELLRFEPDDTLALTRATALQQRAAERGYQPLALGIAVIRLERATAAGRRDEVENLATWVESQDQQIGAAFSYLPTQWSICAASYDAIGRPQDATRLRERAWRWLHETALPEVPPEYRVGFLERNPTNRALRAWAARRQGEAPVPLIEHSPGAGAG